MVHIPFSILPPKALSNLSKPFINLGNSVEKIFPYMQLELERAEMNIEAKKYLSMCIASSLVTFILLGGLFFLIFAKGGKPTFGLIIGLVLSAFIFFIQLNYPKVSSKKKVRKLDVDLLASLRAILIQLNAGVTLFEAITIISTQQFGEISMEFKKVVNRINAGVPQIDALESMAKRNPSPYFRRALWQIINSMKEGSGIKDVISNVIINLTEEQIIQIERYGSQLSPLAMFYMIVAVILPALGITMLIVLTSFIEMSEIAIKMIFWGLLLFVIFFQMMFSGIIKTKRPSLLGG